MPPAEVEISAGLVRRLLREQHPDLAGLPLRRVGGHGWDNAVFRLGSDLSVRLPRRAAAVPLVRNEVRWLPELAPLLPLPVPVPVRSGRPGSGYPWPWTVCRWVPGRLAGLHGCDPTGLVRFLDALHRPAPADAPRNPWRGVPLRERDERLRRDCAVLVEAGWDAGPVLAAWQELLDSPQYAGPPLWIHGDFHPANILVRGREAIGVIDFGDMASGDPAIDYLVAWLLPGDHAPALRDAAHRHGPGTWERARAWALAWGAAAAGASDNPIIARLGQRALMAATPAEGRARGRG